MPVLIICIVGLGAVLFGCERLGYNLMDIGGMMFSLHFLVVAIVISLKGYRIAKIFLVAWSVFLIGVISFILKKCGGITFKWIY